MKGKAGAGSENKLPCPVSSQTPGHGATPCACFCLWAPTERFFLHSPVATFSSPDVACLFPAVHALCFASLTHAFKYRWISCIPLPLLCRLSNPLNLPRRSNCGVYSLISRIHLNTGCRLHYRSVSLTTWIKPGVCAVLGLLLLSVQWLTWIGSLEYRIDKCCTKI